jgi:hypothetical protein
MILTGETEVRVSEEKPVHVSVCPPQNPTWTDLETNLRTSFY